MLPAPERFDEPFRKALRDLLTWRRDVRRFHRDALPAGLVEELIELARLAPSVGLSEPWRFVTVDDPARRVRIRNNFQAANTEALRDYEGERAAQYAELKLAGLVEAPVHLAVFVDQGVAQGHGLGRRTMPETVEYSVVCAVHTLWLAARAYGVGVGWVSILDPIDVADILDVPQTWSLVAYLCLGYAMEDHDRPELERLEWEHRSGTPVWRR